jgi:acyl transferase domain-containing protein
MNKDNLEKSAQLVMLSAESESALAAELMQLRARLDDSSHALDDVASALQKCRRDLPFRMALACDSVDDLRAALTNPARQHKAPVNENAKRRVVFLFPGAGVQHSGMGRDLYRQESVFRDAVESCCVFLRELGADDVLPAFLARHGDEEVSAAIRATSRSGVCIFVYQYAMLRLLASIGVSPDVVIGHSLGEYACAVASGALNFQDALTLMHVRGTLLENLKEPGSMLLVAESHSVVAGLLEKGTVITARNGPRSIIVSGPIAAIDTLAQRFEARGISFHRIRYGAASHCYLVEPVLPKFAATLAGCSLRAPEITWISTVTATRQPTDVVVDANYWCRQFREPVLFSEAVGAVADEDQVLFLEIGPHNGLTNLVKSNVAGATVICCGQHANDVRDGRLAMLDGLGALWVQGVALTYESGCVALAQSIGKSTSSLQNSQMPEASPIASTDISVPNERSVSNVEFVVRGVWEAMFDIECVGLEENFFDLGGHSLLAVRINSELRALFQLELPLSVQFENPTVRGLAKALLAVGHTRNVDVEAIAAALREVSEMP